MYKSNQCTYDTYKEMLFLDYFLRNTNILYNPEPACQGKIWFAFCEFQVSLCWLWIKYQLEVTTINLWAHLCGKGLEYQ